MLSKLILIILSFYGLPL